MSRHYVNAEAYVQTLPPIFEHSSYKININRVYIVSTHHNMDAFSHISEFDAIYKQNIFISKLKW